VDIDSKQCQSPLAPISSPKPFSSNESSGLVGGKTEAKIKSLSRDESNAIGLKIEELIRGDMSYIVNKYIRKYKTSAYDVFGWTPEDLLQQIRIVMWKGLATFQPEKKFKITTYLSVILLNYFLSLSKKCRSNKNAKAKLYCVEEVYETVEEPSEHIDAEMLLDAQQNTQYFMDKLTLVERFVMPFFEDEPISISALANKSGLSKKESGRIIQSIKRKLIAHVKEMEDEEESIFYEGIADEIFRQPITR
jgi:DNA-directed RNA polymerase specialized sigma24 family protein